MGLRFTSICRVGCPCHGEKTSTSSHVAFHQGMLDVMLCTIHRLGSPCITALHEVCLCESHAAI